MEWIMWSEKIEPKDERERAKKERQQLQKDNEAKNNGTFSL